MDVRVSLNGFVYWDGEYNYIEDGEYILGFAFSFLGEGTEYSDFDMEHILIRFVHIRNNSALYRNCSLFKQKKENSIIEM